MLLLELLGVMCYVLVAKSYLGMLSYSEKSR